ncbi:MAG TPA: prephenate dehydratase [Peptococcaceae bacterium]|nr:prephenate dehydratase [Peptococcaceae bacterium]
MDRIENLNKLRQEIDRLDQELLQLFSLRMKTVLQIADYKKANNIPILDQGREQEVLAKTREIPDAFVREQAVRFFQTIMDISKKYQAEYFEKLDNYVQEAASANEGKAEKIKIAEPEIWSTETIILKAKKVTVGFQGVPGSFSEQALREYFAPGGEEFLTRSINYPGFADVCKALQAGEIDYGILPLENSSTGGIAEVYDLLCRYGFYIVGEKCLQVDHNLLALAGTKLEDIREVYSHPQAFLQCSDFLQKYPHWRQAACSNTAVSAKLVAESLSGDKAAIASRRAAELYNLAILAKGINNSPENYTRFIIIGRELLVSELNNKISLAVALAHQPGSLYRTLSHFALNGLNMLKIESRPLPQKTWEYLFYIDFEGNLARPEVQKAVAEIKRASTFFQLLGNYCSDS